jgi:lysozyme family protein
VTTPPVAYWPDAFAWILRAEGGGRLVSDAGGLTRFGISARAHPDVDIASLTRERAEAIYLEHYWHPIHADELPRELALALFDAAVNLGLGTAVKLLQTLLHVEADGIVGPQTLARAVAYSPPLELVARFLEVRLRAYEDIARRRPTTARYLYGWRMRVLRLALDV